MLYSRVGEVLMLSSSFSDDIDITDLLLMVAAAAPDVQIMCFWLGFERRILQVKSRDAGQRMGTDLIAWAYFIKEE